MQLNHYLYLNIPLLSFVIYDCEVYFMYDVEFASAVL